jgi:ABC-type dipeptide/oligopeptide/nickel transport system permease subunit
MSRLRFARTPGGMTGLVLLAIVVGVAIAGPWFAPYSPSETVGIPLTGRAPGQVLGTDYLGRDVLSRVLWGGRSVLLLAGSATILAYLLGCAIGLVTGYSRSAVDGILMRVVDVMLAFPPLLFLLVLATGAGRSSAWLVIGVALVLAPLIARIVRAATLEVSVRPYVEAAVARGERLPHIVGVEILPNILPVVLADLGVRLAAAIILVASVNFLGLGLSPPAADWALMISENRGGITIQPWAVAAPAVMIALLVISVNLVGDAIARTLGTSSAEIELEAVT